MISDTLAMCCAILNIFLSGLRGGLSAPSAESFAVHIRIFPVTGFLTVVKAGHNMASVLI